MFPKAVGVFILPPSVEELERRLRGRGTDSEDVIARRVLGARGEMRHVAEFDYVIINEDLPAALEDLGGRGAGHPGSATPTRRRVSRSFSITSEQD